MALLEPEPRVDPLCDSEAGVAAEAGVSAAVSTADSAADPSSFAFFFLTFFSLSAYGITQKLKIEIVSINHISV